MVDFLKKRLTLLKFYLDIYVSSEIAKTLMFILFSYLRLTFNIALRVLGKN